MTPFAKRLRDLYLEGQPKEPDAIGDALFKGIITPLVVGTSLGEIYHAKESVTRMIASDLDGWGDLEIATDSTFSYEGKSFCYAVHQAFLTKTFDVTERTYEGFLEEMDMIHKSGESPDKKAMDALFLLTHLLHDRPEGPRRYKLPLEIIIASDIQETPRLLAYSMTTDPKRHDVRKGRDAYVDQMTVKDLDRWRSLSNGRPLPEDVREGIIHRIRENHPSADVRIESDRFVVMERDCEMVFAGSVMFDERLDIDRDIAEAFETCAKDKGTGPKKRLFGLQKSLVHLMRDKVMGDESQSTVRCFGVASEDNGTWHVRRVDIQYTHEMILENKNDLETAL
jgi:hypothetical protein